MTPEQTRFLQEFYQDHHDAMLYVANRIVKDPELAADLVSQAFLIAILQIEVVMACDDPSKWLFHVLKNLSLDEYRRSKRRGMVPLDAIGGVPVEPEFIPFQDLLPDGLTREEREILTLRIDRQLDYPEIARLLELSHSACRMRYSRAKRRCAELMKGAP